MDELNTLLLSLSALKPPGANKSKIAAITNLCIAHVNQSPSIVQTIRDRFTTTPSTHKLGVLYVLDAVVRQWVEKARQNKEDPTGDVARSPNSVGVAVATQVLPSLMHDLIQTAPADQKDRIVKMIDIWERGNTFPQQMLADFKQRLGSTTLPSTGTPVGNATVNTGASLGSTPQTQTLAAAAVSGTASLLAGLANIGQQTAQNPPFQNGTQYAATTQQPQQQNVGLSMTAPPMASYAPPVNGQGNGVVGSAAPPSAPSAANVAQLNQFMPQAFQSMPGGTEAFMQFLGALMQQQMPPEQIAQIIGAMSAAQPQQVMPAVASVVPPGGPATLNVQAQAAPFGQPHQSVEQNKQDYREREDDARGYDNDRDRSRSPDPRRRQTPVNRRDSPTYGIYEPHAGHDGSGGGSQQGDQASGSGRRGRKGRNRRDKHRNSPAAQQVQGQQQNNGTPSKEKYIQFDHSLPQGSIKVLSRTLFVGGVSATEAELRKIFGQFGEVQTVIVNREKHHAFVKMVDREDSVKAKLGMEKMKDPHVLNKARQTRWGVGFGPRECSDYSTGISVIPIDRLTEADRRWVINSEYGGTGGRALETGLVIEEPDIEIGQGVSSKAISRRMGPERGFNKPRHGRRGGGYDPVGPKGFGPDPRSQEHRPEPQVGVPPAVPGFGFQLPGM